MPETEIDIEKRNKYGMLCGIVGIFLNLILFAGKLFAGMLSGAISITADAFNNLSDAGSSIITIAGFKMAAESRRGASIWTCEDGVCGYTGSCSNHTHHGL